MRMRAVAHLITGDLSLPALAVHGVFRVTPQPA